MHSGHQETKTLTEVWGASSQSLCQSIILEKQT